MSGPPRPKLLAEGIGPGGIRSIWMLGTLAVVRAVAMVVFADALAAGLVAVVSGDGELASVAYRAAAAVLIRAAAEWASRVVGARAASTLKQEWRIRLVEHSIEHGAESPGARILLATRRLDELDDYFVRVIPSVVAAAVIPVVVGARVLAADWLSALVIALTIPLVPLFMALVGMHTADRVERASAALARLADTLLELGRGLPVLVGLGRLEEQVRALRGVSDAHRRATLRTLRTAFLSALVLELIATISIAVVAVFIGVRLVSGDLPLEIGLLVLILAPECYTPFRELGAAYHASENGLAALDDSRAAVSRRRPSLRTLPGARWRVRGLGIRYPDRAGDVVSDFALDVPIGRIVALSGPSGAGKSSVLSALLGRVPIGAVVEGALGGLSPGRTAWVPQSVATSEPTVRLELERFADGVDVLLRPIVIDELCRRFELAHLLEEDPAVASPGERRRIALARALLRVEAGAELVALDEPTTHLGAQHRAAVLDAIRELRFSAAVVVASHDPAVLALADEIVAVGEPRPASGTVSVPAPSAAPRRVRARSVSEATAVREAPGATDGSARPERGQVLAPDPRMSKSGVLRELLEFARPARGQLLLAVLLGAATLAAGVALGALSGWLIVRASEQPPILFLLVAIVGVRFFGIGRAVLRYLERLAVHDAVFRGAARTRERVWRGLAAAGPGYRRLLRGGVPLDAALVTTDTVRDLVPRVVTPALSTFAVTIGALAATAIILPDAVPTMLGALVVAGVAAPLVAVLADRAAERSSARLRSVVLRQCARMLVAADDLAANGVAVRAVAALRITDRRESALARHSVWALGLAGTVVTATFGLLATAMLWPTAQAVAAGQLPAAIAVALVFLSLSLPEGFHNLIASAQRAGTLRDALGRTAEVAGVASARTAARTARPIGYRLATPRLELDRVGARWPGMDSDVIMALSASVTPSEWLVVRGPSGSGKSTLLSVLLGQLPATSGEFRLIDDDTGAVLGLAGRVAWCPQEAHVFDASIRANLILARGRDERPSDDELCRVLVSVGLGRFAHPGDDGLDARVGPAGTALSGGQRQRLAVARALLHRAEVIALDEPTAHLDAEAAMELLRELRVACRNRVVVVATHDDLIASPSDRTILLSAPERAATVRMPTPVR